MRLVKSMERTGKWAAAGAVFCSIYTAGSCFWEPETYGVLAAWASAAPAGALVGAMAGTGLTRWRYIRSMLVLQSACGLDFITG